MASTNAPLQQEESIPVRKPISPTIKDLAGSLPSKSAAELYGYGETNSPIVSGAPYSLNRLMSSRKSLNAVRSAFVLDLEKRREKKTVSFGLPAETDYGYGDCAPEPPTKRRRFQRRNSKTPQMLMQMKSTLLNFDFSSLDDESSKTDEKANKDEWDGGLEIAEELVMHLQKRRKNHSVVKTA